MRFFIFFFLFMNHFVYAQYTMSNQTVSACEGTLTDSEANTVFPGYYNHNENFSFTICPQGVMSITISFSFFETEGCFSAPFSSVVSVLSFFNTTTSSLVVVFGRFASTMEAA